jgi:AraC-like DNA-binding protein
MMIPEAARVLRETDTTIIDIAFSVEYESQRIFNRLFLRVMGTAPKQYRGSFGQLQQTLQKLI